MISAALSLQEKMYAKEKSRIWTGSHNFICGQLDFSTILSFTLYHLMNLLITPEMIHTSKMLGSDADWVSLHHAIILILVLRPQKNAK